MLTNFPFIGKPATVKVINCQGKVVRKVVVPAGAPAHVINMLDLDDGDYSIIIESNKTSISSVVTKE